MKGGNCCFPTVVDNQTGVEGEEVTCSCLICLPHGDQFGVLDYASHGLHLVLKAFDGTRIQKCEVALRLRLDCVPANESI